MHISISGFRMWVVLFCYMLVQVKTYPLQGWPVYPQTSREYPDDDYYYNPKGQYFYDAPVVNVRAPEPYIRVPYSNYYDSYGHFLNEAPKRHEERLAELPIGQETWYESESTPRWRSNNIDDVNAAFLDNLILTQMAQDAQRRRENARAAFSNIDYEDKENEDEDVKELKALAGKPSYYVPKTEPIIDEDEDYSEDDADAFINWNGNKRSITTAAPKMVTESNVGQKEFVMPRPAPNTHHHKNHQLTSERTEDPFYNKIAHLLKGHEPSKARRIDKRFVAGDTDLVLELRGLKHRIAT